MTFFLTCCNEDATNQGSNFSEGYDTRQDTLKINLRFSSNITFKFKFIWILFFYTNNLLIFLFLKNLNKHKNFWKFSVLLITDYGKLFCESRCQIYRKFPRKKKTFQGPKFCFNLKAFERLASVGREFRQTIYICEIQRIQPSEITSVISAIADVIAVANRSNVFSCCEEWKLVLGPFRDCVLISLHF